MLFSQRKGLKPIKEVIQISGMDNDLRNGIWNVVHGFLGFLVSNGFIHDVNRFIWSDFFKDPVDTLPSNIQKSYTVIRERFFAYKWFDVYDFVEFLAQFKALETAFNFREKCNEIFKRELSGYRFIEYEIAEITSEDEIRSIEAALDITLPAVNTHLQRSLQLLSDRKNPDYRNSIKESISAVEALSRNISGQSNSTLGAALNQIEKSGKVRLHPAFKEALSKLYGYTNDSNGIRHALTDESALDSEDAIFMLIACSAFINYAKEKATKAGISLR